MLGGLIKWIEGKREAISNGAALQMFQSVIEYGRDALKAAMLVNGGAAVALLAFIGKIWSAENGLGAATPLACSLALFAFGVLFAALSTFFTYCTQYSYLTAQGIVKEDPGKSRSWDRWGRFFHLTVLVLVFSSFVLFALGVYTTYQLFVGQVS